MERNRLVFTVFAELLGYPGPRTPELARACGGIVAETSAEAARRLERFAELAERAGPARMEELYTSAFDLAPLCSPYVAHQLFGDGPARALFLARLRAMQREEGFAPGLELPDHAAEVLRFLAAARRGADVDALLEEGLRPATEKMQRTLDEARHPWGDVLFALGKVLSGGDASREVEDARREVMP
jgi:nitrate reductase delta subunit